MPTSPPPPNVTTVRGVADEKGVTPQAVHRACQRGTLTTYRVGHALLIVKDGALRAYLSATEKQEGG